MCVSCGCWLSGDKTKGGDGSHPENPTVMPNVKTTKSPLAGPKK